MNPSEERHYEIVAEIGRGAYGTVYKARDIHDEGKFVALKEIRIQTNSEEGVSMSTVREVAMLKRLENQLNHQHIVRLLDVCHGSRSLQEMRLMLVFEFIDEDLGEFLKRVPSPGLEPNKIQDLMCQILKGVEFLHSNHIVHRDLKPQNILVTSGGIVKLADFGLARFYSFDMALTSVVVTLYYRAPEVLLKDSYGTAVDIWSCGCIFAELHSRRPLFSGLSETSQLLKIFEIMGLPPHSEWPVDTTLLWTSFPKTVPQPIENFVPKISPLAKSLLMKMLIFNHNHRISAMDSLQHPYFITPTPQVACTFAEAVSNDLDDGQGQTQGQEPIHDVSMESRNTSSSSGHEISDNLEANENLDESSEEERDSVKRRKHSHPSR